MRGFSYGYFFLYCVLFSGILYRMFFFPIYYYRLNCRKHLLPKCANKTMWSKSAFRLSDMNGPLSAALLVFAAAALTGVTVADDDKWVWGRSGGQDARADSRVGAASSDEVTRVAKPLLRDHTPKPYVLFQAASNPRLDTKRYRYKRFVLLRFGFLPVA